MVTSRLTFDDPSFLSRLGLLARPTCLQNNPLYILVAPRFSTFGGCWGRRTGILSCLQWTSSGAMGICMDCRFYSSRRSRRYAVSCGFRLPRYRPFQFNNGSLSDIVTFWPGFTVIRPWSLFYSVSARPAANLKFGHRCAAKGGYDGFIAKQST